MTNHGVCVCYIIQKELFWPCFIFIFVFTAREGKNTLKVCFCVLKVTQPQTNCFIFTDLFLLNMESDRELI